MKLKNLTVRNYIGEVDKIRVEDLERRCGVGPADHAFFTDTMGDPICRIRNSPMYNMLVAEFGNEIVGVIQGSIKVVTIHINPSKDMAKVGYILGLRVSTRHRHNGIGSTLVHHLEQWFVANGVDFAYMATEKDNLPSVNLFTEKLGFIKFANPTILVHPIHQIPFQLPSRIEISKLRIEQAEFLYRKFMGSADFFPLDIDKVLGSKLSLGTWVAYPKGETWGEYREGVQAVIPDSWAMLSVWNSGEVFKLRIGKQTASCFLYEMYSRLVDRLFPWFKSGEVFPDLSDPFGFYFMYGVHREGPRSGNMVRTLCKFVHNMASKSGGGCKVIVTEVGGTGEELRHHIPHWKLLSCPEDLWCMKPLRNKETETARLREMTKTPPAGALFVDPREV
ncbi:hypothetical protein RHGRI_036202 [Rhododendron griersonianum]|uniref:N-acetyltransferase domain-containing protein n=1 Tax=Rhododendron griersonianum TaxID=479676 RepID=A0AAV6HMX3_9ERIC|nr:hypothetical protein RHGRI_036202 [Rhododendron griersonianum]